jgi:hypothetical protein
MLLNYQTMIVELTDESGHGHLGVDAFDKSIARDKFGNVTSVLANDAFGHQRKTSTVYEPEGYFPTTTTNALSALRVRYRNRTSGTWGPWESITTGLPLSAGNTLRIVDTDSAAYELDVEATASGGSASVALDLVGR